MPSRAERLARLGLLIAAAGALQAAEGLFPSPAPWFRLGLGNAVVLATLHLLGWREAVWVALGKVFVGSLLGGRFLSPAFALSLCGSLAAAGAMALALSASPPLGFVGVSVVGAQAHALAQLAVASAVLLRSPSLWALTPVLGVVAVGAGVVTGLAAHGVARAIAEASGLPGGVSHPPRAGTR